MSLFRSVVAIALASWLLSASALAESLPRVTHMDLQLRLDPHRQSLEGVAALLVNANGGDRINFQLSPNTEITGVRVQGRIAPYTFFSGVLSVRIANAKQPGQPLSINYRSYFDDPVPDAPIQNEDPSYGVAATISEKGTFLAAGSGWYPWHVESDPTFRVRVEAPLGIEAVTAGRLVRRANTKTQSASVWEGERPVGPLSLSAGNYRIQRAELEGISISTYFYPESEDLAPGYMKAATDYLKLYQELFGPYPFGKFAIVENFFPTGYGFPSWTLLGRSVIRLPFIVETSLGHEIAHSWWGTGVRVDLRQGNWSEGLTSYVAEHLYKERSSAAEGREYRLNILRDYAALAGPAEDFALMEFLRRDSRASQAVGYGKSAMVFHMVRKRIGEEAFWGGLKKIATEKMYQKIAWEDFAEAFSETSGRSMLPFMRQWLERPGAPELTLDRVTVSRKDQIWQVKGELVQSGGPYDLDIPLLLETTGEPVRATLTAATPRTVFEFTSSEKPLRLLVDPEVDCFRRLAASERPPTVNSLRAAKNLVVVVSDQLPKPIAQAALQLLIALRQERTPVLSELEATAERLAGKNLLLIGLPLRRELLPELPEELQLIGNKATLGGKTWSLGESTLFATIGQAEDSERITALFVPESAESASSAVRKIPHYGKFSYLVFVAGVNQEKGTWPAGRSPLIKTLTPREGQP
ncbi:MAG: M1 family metallopeptidase [Trichloromonadaceae bacterium]